MCNCTMPGPHVLGVRLWCWALVQTHQCWVSRVVPTPPEFIALSMLLGVQRILICGGCLETANVLVTCIVMLLRQTQRSVVWVRSTSVASQQHACHLHCDVFHT